MKERQNSTANLFTFHFEEKTPCASIAEGGESQAQGPNVALQVSVSGSQDSPQALSGSLSALARLECVTEF